MDREDQFQMDSSSFDQGNAEFVITNCEQPIHPLINWASIEIQEETEEQGRVEICNEDQVYELLGLREDEMVEDDIEAASNSVDHGATNSEIPNVEGTEGASMAIDDSILEERVMVYDKDNLSMEVRTLYPSMEEFRLAVRQYAINREFELGIEATTKRKYRGYCKGGNCTWAIVGRTQADNMTVMVTSLTSEHKCTSSSRRRTTTPSCKWVASKAVSILRKNSQMGTLKCDDQATRPLAHARRSTRPRLSVVVAVLLAFSRISTVEEHGEWGRAVVLLGLSG